MKIYNAEQSIAHLIEGNTSVAYSIEPNPEVCADFSFVQAKLNKDNKSDDLYPIYSLLVSSVWNGNDDVFSAEEIWKARKTPINHPSNINHDQLDIVGHITDVWVVDQDMNLIPDDTKAEDLPELIHIINESVIYTHFNDDQKLGQVLSLIESIEARKKFVSMEALFTDFDYSVITPEGKPMTVARTEDSAFLTKHLRAYGGAGMYQGYKVGRQLKDFVFIGKGYVDKPANKGSVIFTEGLPFVAASVVDNIDDFNGVQLDNQILENNMSNEVETQLSEALAEVATLKEELATIKSEASMKQVSEMIDENANLAEMLSVKDGEMKDMGVKVQAAEQELEEVKAEVESLKTQLAEAEATIAEAKETQKRTVRVAALAAVGYRAEEAKELVEKYFDLSDEQWETIAEVFVNNPPVAEEAEVVAEEAQEEAEEVVAEEEVEVVAEEEAVAEEAEVVEEVVIEDNSAQANLNIDVEADAEAEQLERNNKLQTSVAALLKRNK
jgi:hypothetical protein